MKSDKEIKPKNFSSRWRPTVRCVQVSLYWSTRHLMHVDEWRSSPVRWFHSIPKEEEEESLRRLKRLSERAEVSKHSNTSKMIIIKPSFIRFASPFKIILLSDIWNYRSSMASFVRIFIDNAQQNEDDSSFQLKINDKCTLRLSRTATAREINCVFFLVSSRVNFLIKSALQWFLQPKGSSLILNICNTPLPQVRTKTHRTTNIRLFLRWPMSIRVTQIVSLYVGDDSHVSVSINGIETISSRPMDR